MNIVEFYKKLSKILEMAREKSISHSEAEYQLKELLSKAEEGSLDVNISEDILKMDNLVKYDDEMSYEEPYSYDSESENTNDEESSY